jgi:F-type H+-transporting ATPase subunit delta
MKNPAVAKRYADALFDVVNKQGQIDTVEAEYAGVVQALREHPELGNILAHPSISQQVKKEQFIALFDGRVSLTLLNFLKVLFDARRQESIEEVYEEFVRSADSFRGVVKAQVETAVPLTEEELTTLKNTLGANGKQVAVTATVNPALIGGARVRVGDRVLDYTVVGQLERFRQTLKY